MRSSRSVADNIALGKPAYVTHISPEDNTVTLGDLEDLDRKEMSVARLNWMKYEEATDGMEVTTKVRYRDAGTLSNLYNNPVGVTVRFYEDVKGIAPGQSAVFYEGDDVVGGGIIQRD